MSFTFESKTPTDVSIGDASIKTSTKETLLGILIDSELSFDQHISSICSKASKKLHALGRIGTFRSFNKCRTLMKAFIESQFNYCLLIQMFHSRKMNSKIYRIHERTLRLLYSNYASSFDELLKKDRSLSIHHRKIQVQLLKFTNFFTVFLQLSRGTVLQWLSLLHNFIQLSLKPGFAQVQTLLVACQRFAMVRIRVGQPYPKNNSSSSSSSSSS